MRCWTCKEQCENLRLRAGRMISRRKPALYMNSFDLKFRREQKVGVRKATLILTASLHSVVEIADENAAKC